AETAMSGERSSSLSVVRAPMRSPPEASTWTPRNAPPSRRKLTRRLGWNRRDCSNRLIAVPPATGRTAGSSGSSAANASASVAGSTTSKVTASGRTAESGGAARDQQLEHLRDLIGDFERAQVTRARNHLEVRARDPRG